MTDEHDPADADDTAPDVTDAPEVEPFAVTNPPAVVAGELIQSAWGNAVVNVIGNVAGLPVGSGAGSIANHLFDNNATAVGAQTLANTANSKADTNSAQLLGINKPAPASPVTAAAGSITSAESTLVTWTAPVAGLFLIGFTINVAGGSGYGFIDAYLKKNGGLSLVAALMPIRYFEQGGRQTVNGLCLMDVVAGEVVHLRAKTFTASVPTEGSQMVPMQMRTP